MKINKRGIALIVTFMVVVVLTILSSAAISRSISERFIAQRYAESTQAFWLAEAGVNRALYQLKNDCSLGGVPLCDNDDNSPTACSDNCGQTCKFKCSPGARIITDTLPLGEYYACVKDLNATQRQVTAHGCIPSITSARAERKITVLVQCSNLGDPGLITKPIESTSLLDIGGSVLLIPPGSPQPNPTITFEQVFGMNKDQVKAIAVSEQAQGRGHVYTDPRINQQPVNGITWVDLTGSNSYKISSRWSGSGLLIVNGNGTDVALEISGGWQFSGLIWVIGRIKMSGTLSVITGAVFVESSTGTQSFLGGNVTLNFSQTEVESAFGLLSQAGVLSWREL